MAHINKPVKKLEKLKATLNELDSIRNIIIKVIEQGGDVAFEWENTGIEDIMHHQYMFKYSNGAQKFTIIIPPHDTCK